jgi:hypothetical protein
MSDEAATWTAAFVQAQADLPEISKNRTAKIETKSGGSFSYKYAELPDIIAAVRPVLAANGLAFAQSIEARNGAIGVTTRIYHSSGHVEEFGPVVIPSGEEARAIGSAITYARRYGLVAALGIAADEDDDASMASIRNRAVVKGKGSGAIAGAAATVQRASSGRSEDDPDARSEDETAASAPSSQALPPHEFMGPDREGPCQAPNCGWAYEHPAHHTKAKQGRLT